MESLDFESDFLEKEKTNLNDLLNLLCKNEDTRIRTKSVFLKQKLDKVKKN